MEEIVLSIEKLKNSISKLEKSDYTEVFEAMTEAIENLSDKVEEIIVNNESLEENISFLNSDLSNIQEEIFEEVTFEDLEEIEDEYVEIKCKNCGKPLFAEKSVINGHEEIPCPYCNSNAN
ncbi:MAG: CD1247 N-terminal domain-containing protein [Clostridium sp.]